MRLSLIILATVLEASLVASSDRRAQQNDWTFGSEGSLITRIEQREEGSLTRQGMQQVSLFAIQILLHLNKAADQYVLDELEEAQLHVDKASRLVELVRSILPVRIVTTTVEDAQGNTAYSFEERIHPDLIPVVLAAPGESLRASDEAEASLSVATGSAMLTLDLAVVDRAIESVARGQARPEDSAHILITAQREGLHSPDSDNQPLIGGVLSDLEWLEDEVKFSNPVEVTARLHHVIRGIQKLRAGMLSTNRSRPTTQTATAENENNLSR